MRGKRVVVCLFLASSLTLAQRHKPSIDPETKEGYVLQLIQQERDPAQKVKLLNDFIAEFPKSASLAWIYDQLQPVYVESKNYDRVIALGAKMLEVDPDNIEGAHSTLLAAEQSGNPEFVRQAAAACWQVATRLSRAPGYPKTDYARQISEYSEFVMASVANRETDPRKRQEGLKALEQLNPKSPFLHGSRNEVFSLSQGPNREAMVAVAERTIAADPNNEDMLIMVADYHMQRGDMPDKVLDYSTRVVEILKNKTSGGEGSAEDWDKKKEKYLGAANYMIGVVSSIQGRYVQADRSLRAALPTMRNTGEQVLGALLYHLGYANYQLAEKGERGRVFDAIKFNEQCATVKSTYREQAQKNVDSIKSEYNLR